MVTRRVRCPHCRKRLRLQDDHVIPPHGRAAKPCKLVGSVHPNASGRTLDELADLVVRRLASEGPVPFGTLVEQLELTTVETGRLNAAIDRGQLPGVYRRRRSRRPRSIIGIEGDSRTWPPSDDDEASPPRAVVRIDDAGAVLSVEIGNQRFDTETAIPAVMQRQRKTPT